MDQNAIDFIGIVNDNCSTLAADADYSKLFLIEAAVKGDKSLIADISDNRFNLMKTVSSHLFDKEGDLGYVVCSLINEEFKENNSNLNWVINLFDYTAYTKAVQAIKKDEKPEIKIRLLNQWGGAVISYYGIIQEIIEELYTIKMTNIDDYDLVIDGVFGQEPINNKDAIKIFYTDERIPASQEGYDLSLGFDYIEVGNNYMRFSLYYLYFGNKISTSYQREGECNPNKPYFSCFLVSNPDRGDGAISRTQLFHLLSEYKSVVSGGLHLNNIGRNIPENETSEFFSQCKFVIAYENDGSYPGYITEKVFRAYFSGAIPIYYSHPSSQDDINLEAIISAQRFSKEEDMIEYIKEIDSDDIKYCKIWNQQIITEASRDYNVIKDQIRTRLAGKLNNLNKTKI